MSDHNLFLFPGPGDSPDLNPIDPVDYSNEKFQKIIDPLSYLSVDVSMIPIKGRSNLKYLPMKPIKRRYKVWCLADSSLGYIIKFEIYTGKSLIPMKDMSLEL